MNRIWRSDAPTAWADADAELMKKHGMTTIIDLRTDAESERKPCAYADTFGFDYRRFPIAAGSVPPQTLQEVPVSYMQIALQKETADALRTVAEASGGVMFCCTAGKDRTGVVAALILLACGVDRRTIIRDYAVSREYNRIRLEKYLAEHPEVDRQVVLANESSMQRFTEMFFERFGSVEAYFDREWLAPEHLRCIRSKLLE